MTDTHTAAPASPRPPRGEETPFDITKQVWTFDPEDFGITIDGSWDLCYLGDPDDYPCVVDDDVDLMKDQVVACGHAIAAVPKLIAALARLDKFWLDGHPAGPDDPERIVGRLSDETVSIWLEIRAVLAAARPELTP